jgi:hypothetical protein
MPRAAQKAECVCPLSACSFIKRCGSSRLRRIRRLAPVLLRTPG